MSTHDRQSMLHAACDVLAKALPSAWAIYVHGSFARGEESSDSDLDLAVLLPPKVVIEDKLEVIAAVSRAAGREADLVSLREANLDLVSDVLRDGRALLVRRPDETLAWEAERMTEFAFFNPRRSEIIDMYMRKPLRGGS